MGLPSPGAAESTKPSQAPELHVFRLYGDDSDVGRHRKSLMDEKIEDDEYKYDRCKARHKHTLSPTISTKNSLNGSKQSPVTTR